MLGFPNVFGMYSKYFAKRVPLYDICYGSTPMFIFNIEHSFLFYHTTILHVLISHWGQQAFYKVNGQKLKRCQVYPNKAGMELYNRRYNKMLQPHYIFVSMWFNAL